MGKLRQLKKIMRKVVYFFTIFTFSKLTAAYSSNPKEFVNELE